MENTNTTKLKKRNEKDFLIFIDQFDVKEKIEQKLLQQDFTIIQDRKSAHVIIDQSHQKSDKLEIHFQDDHIHSSIKNLPIFINELRNFHLSSDDVLLLLPQFKKNKKTSPSILKAPFFTLNKFALNSNSIIDFCQYFFSESFFKNFSSFYLFTHRKGSSTAKLSYITMENFKSQTMTTTEFNRLFNAIKKSKNGSFGHASLKGASFNIVGTCLAKEFFLNAHNVIFIISKDEFIPQNENDVLNYESLCDYLPYFFNLFLEKENYSNQIEKNRQLVSLVSNSDQVDPNQLKYAEHLSDYLSKIQEENFNLLDVNHKERISLLGELLNTLKHELSNPLFGLELSSEILELDKLASDAEEFVYEIKLAIHRCQDIISNFSDIFMESSPIKELNLIKLIEEVLTLTKSKSKHIKKEIFLNSLPLKLDDKLIIKTNKTILAQIFFNLIINSAQALGEERKDPRIKIDITTDENTITILISDNGPGLADEIIPKIFVPFFTTKKQGTGLGLSICKNLIHKLSGDLKYLKSDNGASFLIKLPNEYPTH